jgi:hypothetical protein
MNPETARLTLARKIAAITLLVWKKGVRFDPQYIAAQRAIYKFITFSHEVVLEMIAAQT